MTKTMHVQDSVQIYPTKITFLLSTTPLLLKQRVRMNKGNVLIKGQRYQSGGDLSSYR